MKYIATILLVFMTVTLVISGILLWKRRKEASDYSRIIWADIHHAYMTGDHYR